MKFNTKVEQMMKESLLEGQADYGDVLDALEKLKKAVSDFAQIYPAGRGTHIHAAYKAEVDRMNGRVMNWISKQNAFVQKSAAKKINPDTDAVSLPAAA